MNKKTKKVLLTVFCAVLLVAGSIMGTIAYLTDTAGTVTNTFTVGKVDIDLFEHKLKVDNDGNPVLTNGKMTLEDTEVKQNTYKLMPGMTYPKDPTIRVETGSENCYLGAVVTLTVDDITKTPIWQTTYQNVALTGFVTGGISTATEWQWSGTGMTYVDQNNNTVTQKVTLGTVTNDVKAPDVITFTYVLDKAYKAGDKVTLFEEIHTDLHPELWTNEAIAGLGDFTLTVDAYAVQSEGVVAASGENAALTGLKAAFNTTDKVIF